MLSGICELSIFISMHAPWMLDRGHAARGPPSAKHHHEAFLHYWTTVTLRREDVFVNRNIADALVSRCIADMTERDDKVRLRESCQAGIHGGRSDRGLRRAPSLEVSRHSQDDAIDPHLDNPSL